MTDAILRMFNDSKSFYYSFTGDLTRSLLQQYSKNTEDEEKTSLPLWKKVCCLLDQTMKSLLLGHEGHLYGAQNFAVF